MQLKERLNYEMQDGQGGESAAPSRLQGGPLLSRLLIRPLPLSRRSHCAGRPPLTSSVLHFVIYRSFGLYGAHGIEIMLKATPNGLMSKEIMSSASGTAKLRRSNDGIIAERRQLTSVRVDGFAATKKKK